MTRLRWRYGFALMNKLWHGIDSPNLATHSTSVLAGWPGSVFLGLALFFAYMINGRDLGTYDTISASLLPLYILRGDGIYFDNEHLGQVGLNKPIPDFLTISHGRVVTLYPIAPALVAVPFFAPQVAVLDRYRPGWDRDRAVALAESVLMAKRAMALVVALTGVVLYRLLYALGLSARRCRLYWRPAWDRTSGPWVARRHGSTGRLPCHWSRRSLSCTAGRLVRCVWPWQGYSRPCSSPAV